MIAPAQPAPWFITPGPSNPHFAFSSLGGRFVLLAFLPRERAAAARMTARLEGARDLLDGVGRIGFRITSDPEVFGAARDQVGLQWFFDPTGAIARGYGAVSTEGVEVERFVLIDPTLRVLDYSDGDAGAEALFRKLERLPDPNDHAGVPLTAPVLVVPRIFEPDLCQRLIALYEAEGGVPSGTMVDRDGKTIPVLSDFKSRRDVTIEDDGLCLELRTSLERRLLPEIRKAFQFRPTRIERYIVACYDSAEGGRFKPHRDNTTKGTAHRQFACSINLNAEDFEGGDLRFPEFGSRTYRPPTGGAVVFSCSLLHEATPVSRGRRYAFLPFFYDETGQKLREANLPSLDLSGATRQPAEPAPT